MKLTDIKFKGNECVDKDFTEVSVAAKEMEVSCKRTAKEMKNFDNIATSTTSKTNAGLTIGCRRTSKNFWPYNSERLETCLLNQTVSITKNNTRFSTDYKAKGLYMKFNRNISLLPIDIYKAFPELIVIDATYCTIKAIGPSNFMNLKSMRFLWLGGNLITNIPKGTFKGLVSLYNLDLREFSSFLKDKSKFISSNLSQDQTSSRLWLQIASLDWLNLPKSI